MLKKILGIKIPLRYILNGFLGIAGFLTLTPYLAKLWWVLELTCHFRVQYFVVLSVIFLIALFLRKWKTAGLAVGLASINLISIIPLYLPVEKSNRPMPDESIKIIYANVFTPNREIAALNQMISREKPDIIILSEINERWTEQLHYLESEFLFSRKFPRPDNFGIGIYSKMPLTEFNRIYLSRAEVPALRANFRIDNRPITLLGIHTLPPIGSLYFADRNEQLKRLAEEIVKINNPVIVIGDFNITSWSPYFRDLVKKTGLRDSRKGFGLQPTSPTFIPPLLIPIDHCLASPEIIIKDRRTGPHIGSDHYPIIVEVGIFARDRK